MNFSSNNLRSYLSITLTLALFASCDSPKQEQPKEIEPATEQPMVEEESAPTVDSEAVVKSVDELRNSIEEQIKDIEPTTLITTSARPRIAQKWSKIHYYALDGQIIRMKTYPHPGISKRTEEFYLNNDQLVLATIEDMGDVERGKDKSEIDKMYYYKDGSFVSESNNSTEPEYSIKKSEAEELMQECMEYLDLYPGGNE